MRLIDAPVGLFLFDGILVMKTEYFTESNGVISPDCYIVDSGECFCGGVNTPEERNALEVTPVDAVVLPCKIGDTVWAIRRFHDKKRPTSGIVSEMFFTQQMKLEIVVKFVARGEWGKTVFATREEAEAALAERKNE